MPYQLARSLSDLDQYLALHQSKNIFGLDTEGSGLDTRRAKLAGFSLSFEEGDGIYVPVGHNVGQNLPFKPAWERVQKRIDEGAKPIFFHAKFDLTILQVATALAGLPWKIKDYGDGLELVYLADPDRKRKGLKLVAKQDLGFDMEKFESLFTEQEIRSEVLIINNKNPERCIDYACSDADAHLRVWKHYEWVHKEFSMASKIDHLLIPIVARMEHNGGMELNTEYIDEQIDLLEKRAEALKEQIHRTVGYAFELNSPKQLGIALFEKMRIPSPGKTRGKNPIHVTKEEVLEKLRTAYPFVELIISYKKVVKARSAYFMKLRRLGDLKKPPRFNFNMFSAPTFRFSAPGGDPEVDGATGVNIQAVSNGEARDVFGVDLKEAPPSEDYASLVSEEDILVDLGAEKGAPIEVKSGWDGNVLHLPYVIEAEKKEDSDPERHVCVRETCNGCPAECALKGIDVTRRNQKNVKMVPSVRQAFRAKKGYKLVSFDYDRQELVIGANMSGEPRWLRALAEDVDLHSVTAAAAFGIPFEDFLKLKKTNPAEFKRKRDIGKTLNFAIFYGATAYTLANKADISQAAAEQIYDGFTAGHPVLMGWIQKCHIFSRKHGYTTTYFGRKRWLKDLYEDPRPAMQSFADRSAVNTAIQGTAAEVTRIAMVKVEKRLREHGYKWSDVGFALQIHDELAFLIRNELVKEAIPIIREGMEFKVNSWQVQLSCSPKVGQVWGRQQELKYEELAAGDHDAMLMAA